MKNKYKHIGKLRMERSVKNPPKDTEGQEKVTQVDTSSHVDPSFTDFKGNVAGLRNARYEINIQPKIRNQTDNGLHQGGSGVPENSAQSKTGLTSVEPRIQRKPLENNKSKGRKDEPAGDITGETSHNIVTPGLIVDDTAKDLLPGQMHKSVFLSTLYLSVKTTAESALAGTIWSALGCPWIDHWFAKGQDRSARDVERAIQRYAGVNMSLASAADYIPIICSKVRRSIQPWVDTGRIEGVPEVVSAGLPGSDSSGIDPSSNSGGIAYKEKGGSIGSQTDPGQVKSRLGRGRSLDNGVRSQMETAFGRDFSGVRVHTGAKGATLSSHLNARAFTIGNDISFGQGEYNPGTLVGDALIAHELAHVVQQSGGKKESMPEQGTIDEGSLEEQADLAAVSAMTGHNSNIFSGIGSITKPILSRLKSGLRLQRCKKQKDEKKTKEKVIEKDKKLKPEWLKITHQSGRVYEVPGILSDESEFKGTGVPSAFEQKGSRRKGRPITGGFKDEIALTTAFATFTETTEDKKAKDLIKKAGSKIDPQLIPIVTHVIRDKFIYNALNSFLFKDNGKLVAWPSGGRYDFKKPPTIAVGMGGGVHEIRVTFVHELMHYIFDKKDSVLSESPDGGGADHPAISALETRFLIIDLIRAGKPPFSKTIDDNISKYIKGGNLILKIQEAVKNNDKEKLERIVGGSGFIKDIVARGVFSTSTGLVFPDRPDSYKHTPEQFKEMGYIWAQNAAVIRKSMLEAIRISKKNNIPLSKVFETNEWKQAMIGFTGFYFASLKAFPKMSPVTLANKMEKPHQ